MRRFSRGGRALASTSGLVPAIIASWALAQEPAPLPQRLPTIQPTIVEYRWVFLAPEWVVEPRTVEGPMVVPAWQPLRVDFSLVDWTSERRKIGKVADFSCKYSDFWLPNECRTTWRDVYIDVPVPVVRRDSFDMDVLQLWSQETRTTVDVARLVWKERSLLVSLPAIAVANGPP